MSQRTDRVNELVKREVSQVLHTRYQKEAVAITISSVEIAPDLRAGKVFYSVVGDDEAIQHARLFFGKNAKTIRHAALKNIVLKYTPVLEFVYDDSIERGERVLKLLEELEDTSQT